MKRNLLLLAVMILVAFGFNLAQGAQHPNDMGVADTLYLEVWPADVGMTGYPADVKYAMYVTNDIPDDIRDSVAGFVVPLCYTSSNTAANATINVGKNKCGAQDLIRAMHPTFYNLNLSIFQDLPSMEDPQVPNWMMDLSDPMTGLEWDTRILDLSTGDFRLSLVASGSADQRFKGGNRVLLATIKFTIDDSTNICVDTCHWPPTGQIAFSRADAVTYIPQIWDDYIPAEWYCVEHYTIPNLSPVIDPCPAGMSHSENGSYATGAFTVVDPDCPTNSSLNSATVTFTGTGVVGLGFGTALTVGDCSWTSTVTYTVDNHCLAGGTIMVEVFDNQGASDTCYIDVDLTNDAPVVTCPASATVKYCDGFTGLATATDANGDAVTFSGDAAADGSMDFTYTCQDVGVNTYTVVGTDVCGATGQCQFTVTVTNAAPTISCPDNAIATAGSPHMSTDFVAADDCNDFSVAVGIAPPSVNAPSVVGSHVEWQTDPGEEGTFTLTLTVTDGCGLTAFCTYEVEVVSYGFTTIFIPNSDCVNPGEYVCLPILIDNNTTPFGGFEIAVEFDYTSMTFVGAEKGSAIEGFENFTYRLLPCPSCGCCKYKILLYGQYDMPNGAENVGDPIPMTGMGVFETLVDLCFVVNNNENLRGLKIPVCFEWEGTIDPQTGCLVEDWNCGENTFSSLTGDTLYTSDLCCQFVADLCDDPSDRVDGKLFFQWHNCGQNCGGVDVCAAGPGLCKRGDINMNDVTYDVADAVLFASYFVEGTVVFRYDLAYQICATDVNADGRTLTLSDLVYLIRVILQDAVEIPKLTPSSEVANVIVYNGTISTECAAPIGAILFEFDSAVSPTLLADMEMVHNGNKVLVWSSTGNSFTSAEVLTADAELVSVSAVDRDSR
ncbi:MAG: hypothetical protein WBC42_01055, partial [Candidatus Zixiibacteriota bacterium]